MPKEVAAQTTAKDLVGTWTLVSVTLEQDGNKSDLFGPNPQGQVTFDSNGRMSLIINRSDLPKFASNNRHAGTPEENKAVVQGSIAYFGTYSVSETDKTVATHIEGGTFPNWIGTDQKRLFTISGDELKWTTPTTSLGSGTALDVWKRAKGQQKTLKELIVGTWLLDSVYDQAQDGRKNEPWGPNVKGIVVFDGNGRFSFQIISADRSKSASNNPRNPVGQAVGYFGTYTVDEAAKTVTYHIERATFPQWDGIDRTANITIDTENEFNQISAPVQDPSLGTIILYPSYQSHRSPRLGFAAVISCWRPTQQA